MSPRGHNFVSALLSLGPERELSIVRDRRGNPTPADALAALLVSLSERIASGEALPPGRYHLVGKPAVSLVDLARHVFAARAARGEAVPDFDIVEGSQRPGESARPSDSSLDTSFTERCLGITLPAWRRLIP
jgi:dTDP-4-dehydrorhamnose reductase